MKFFKEPCEPLDDIRDRSDLTLFVKTNARRTLNRSTFFKFEVFANLFKRCEPDSQSGLNTTQPLMVLVPCSSSGVQCARTFAAWQCEARFCRSSGAERALLQSSSNPGKDGHKGHTRSISTKGDLFDERGRASSLSTPTSYRTRWVLFTANRWTLDEVLLSRCHKTARLVSPRALKADHNCPVKA